MRLRHLHETISPLEVPTEIVFNAKNVWNTWTKDIWQCRVAESCIGKNVVALHLKDVDCEGNEGVAALNIVKGIGNRAVLDLERMYVMTFSADPTASVYLIITKAFERIAHEIRSGNFYDAECPNASFPTPVEIISTRIQT